MRKAIIFITAFFQTLISISQECDVEAIATLTTELWGTEISYSISDDNGILLAEEGFGDYGTYTSTFCIDNVSNCLVLEMNDSFGDGWNGAQLYITIPSLGITLGTYTLAEGHSQSIVFGNNCETEVIAIEGCTDTTAYNYDPTATTDDGSCIYECLCDDIYEPVCGYDYTTGTYQTFNNICEAECAQSIFIYEGDCEAQQVEGCTDSEALNYNVDATADDGSCIYEVDCGNPNLMVIATLYTEMWGTEVSYTISNSEDIIAQGQGVANHDSTSTFFCLADTTDCLTLQLFDSFGDGWNGASLTISLINQNLTIGTYTLEAGNSQVLVIGSNCEESTITGCTDPSASNYNELAIVDDGTCVYDCECEELYSPVCAIDLMTGLLTTYQNACEAECAQAIVVSEGDCENQPVYGCTDPDALNFNSNATEDDGSCINTIECSEDEVTVLVNLHTEMWGSEVSFVISQSSSILAEGQAYNDYTDYYTSFCLNDTSGCLQLELIDSFGDGWNGATLDISIPSQDLYFETITLNEGYHQALSFGIGCEIEVIETEGCTDPLAFNYNQYATIDNGTCSYECECDDVYDPVCAYNFQTGEYITFDNACEAACDQAYVVWDGDCADQPIYGCTDVSAINYNENATMDDGSCVTIPTCDQDEMAIAIEVNINDSIADLGYGISWSLTDADGIHVTLVYDYSNWQATNAYGCLQEGCYNFFMYDYGWGMVIANVDVTLGDTTTTYAFAPGELEAAYPLSVNTSGCEVFIPVYGCMDSEALNYNPEANTDDGSCIYPCECEDIYDPVCAFDYFTNDYVTFNNICEAECWNAWIIWDGDCSEQPIYGCTDIDALNFMEEATDDDGSCVYMPVCEDNETEIMIQSVPLDSLSELTGVSLHWSLTTDLGIHINLAYQYEEDQTISYGCVADGCYNFYLNDFGWMQGINSVEVYIEDELSIYSVPAESYNAVFAISVGVEDCIVTVPGCTDPNALNYYADATIDDGSCQYPFICESGEVGYVYLYTSILNSSLSIISEDGDVVFSGEDSFNFGGIYGEVCLEQNTCYHAIVAGDINNDIDWVDGFLGVSSASQDIEYAEWPIGEAIWSIQFSLNGMCDNTNLDWEMYVGCTDPQANNFNPDALIDDGTCAYASLCGDLYEVEFVLDGGLNPDEVGLNVSDEEGTMLMEMNGYTGSSIGCVPSGCYTVEMIDSSGDGWNEALAELYVNGEYVDYMTLEEGGYEMRVVGLGVDCDANDPGSASIDQDSTTETWNVSLFPNPGHETVIIASNLLDINDRLDIQVYNVDGRLMNDISKVSPRESNKIVVDASTWPQGVYFIQIRKDSFTKQLQWIKMN